MTADAAALPASPADVGFAPEPDAASGRSPLLQVEPGNDPARALYLRCGFADSHRYHDMMAP